MEALGTRYRSSSIDAVIATSKKFATDNPDVLERLAVINATTIKYMRSYPDESSKIIAKASGRDEKDVRDAYNYMIYPWRPPRVNEAGCKTILQWLVDSGKIDQSLMKPDLEAWWKGLYDPTFEEKVIKSGLIEKLDAEGVPAQTSTAPAKDVGSPRGGPTRG